MQPQILFLQGGGEGAYKEDAKLVAYLRDALEPAYQLRYPKMPAENNPDYKKWKVHLSEELAALKDGVILIGHSLGGSFLLKYVAEEVPTKTIAGLFLIAIPFWGGNGWRYEGYEQIALPGNFAGKLPGQMPIYFYHSQDDEVVPFAHVSLYAERLPQATIRVLNKRGHQFNNDLSEVVTDIKNLAGLIP
jgi:uncharacterized protein